MAHLGHALHSNTRNAANSVTSKAYKIWSEWMFSLKQLMWCACGVITSFASQTETLNNIKYSLANVLTLIFNFKTMFTSETISRLRLRKLFLNQRKEVGNDITSELLLKEDPKPKSH